MFKESFKNCKENTAELTLVVHFLLPTNNLTAAIYRYLSTKNEL